jgi:uncharacterized protein (DUF302 family)
MMRETRYGLKVTVPVPFDEAIARATDALKSQGFGVLTTIDVKQTLKAKLDREFRKYVILGACNPPLADRALHAELEVGLLLPCNVVVYEENPNTTVVAAMAPLAALGIVGDNLALTSVAREADERLRKALHTLETQAGHSCQAFLTNRSGGSVCSRPIRNGRRRNHGYWAGLDSGLRSTADSRVISIAAVQRLKAARRQDRPSRRHRCRCVAASARPQGPFRSTVL